MVITMRKSLAFLIAMLLLISAVLSSCGSGFLGDNALSQTLHMTGKEAAAALDAAGIVVNKNTIPYDTESPFKTSGIRVGTASVTTRGMKEAEMIKIGTWIADVLDNIADTTVQERVKREAAALVANFPVP